MSIQKSAKVNAAIDLLKCLIAMPSISKDEHGTAEILEHFFQEADIPVQRSKNNIWVENKYCDKSKPTLLLNSHHDTVKVNQGYTKDPFDPIVEDGKLFGLGSNDAGGSLVCLIQCFMHFFDRKDLPYNIVFAATSEEEISGKDGVESILKSIGPVELGMVGEPTGMQLAVAEKGLMVMDCYAKGVAGHAAREEGTNAIYAAMTDLDWFRTYQFEKNSEFLGPMKMTVTMIDSGTQHNVVPDICHFVVDVRINDCYSNEEVIEVIKDHVACEVIPRSTRLQSSHLPKSHLINQVAEQLGVETYGSPTLSDQALMHFPTFKMGPGESSRSHSPDEFIYLKELEEGVTGYIALLETLLTKMKNH